MENTYSDRYLVTIQEDEEGNAILPIPEPVLIDMGWKEGTVLEWIDNQDGSFMLKEKVETELVLVETISQFRQRYIVEVPKGQSEYACDSVTMEEAQEFSQEHLGETIVSHRVMTEQEALDLCDIDNSYAKNWETDLKVKTFITPWQKD